MRNSNLRCEKAIRIIIIKGCALGSPAPSIIAVTLLATIGPSAAPHCDMINSTEEVSALHRLVLQLSDGYRFTLQ